MKTFKSLYEELDFAPTHSLSLSELIFTRVEGGSDMSATSARRGGPGSSANHMFGKKHTEKTKRKIGVKSINRNWNRIIGSGSKNPNAKKVSVVLDGEIFNYDCLKEFYNENQHIPYNTLKSIALDGRYSKKYNLEITYA